MELFVPTIHDHIANIARPQGVSKHIELSEFLRCPCNFCAENFLTRVAINHAYVIRRKLAP